MDYGDLQLLIGTPSPRCESSSYAARRDIELRGCCQGMPQTRKMKPWPAIADQGWETSTQGQVNRCGFASAINLNFELQLITFVQAR